MLVGSPPVWKRSELDKSEESRRYMVVGETVSVVVGVDCEECQTRRLNGRGCLMGSPANNTSKEGRKLLLNNIQYGVS